MKIRLSILIFGLILVIPFLLIFSPYIMGTDFQKVLETSEVETHEWFKNRVQNYEIHRCLFDLKNPYYAFVFQDQFKERIGNNIYFYSLNRYSLFSQSFISEYIGGTTIENTTYENLLQMVKQDCTQFQKNHYIGDSSPHWIYNKAKSPEEIAKEEAEKQKELEEQSKEIQPIADEVRKIFVALNELPDSIQKEITTHITSIGLPGDWNQLNNFDVLHFATIYQREKLPAELVEKIDQFFKEQGKYSIEEYMPY